MQLYFKNVQVEKTCCDRKHATKELGSLVAKKLGHLIVRMYSAKSLLDLYVLPQYRVHKLKGDRQDQYSITICKSSPYRLIVYPLDENLNILKSGNDEKKMLAKALIIEILEVGDYHD